MSGGRFCRLSAPGLSALSIWRLAAPPEDLQAVAGRRALPEVGRPVRVSVPDGSGGLLDEGVLWLREAGEASVAELHLHGGAGVAAALRARLRDLGWREDSPPRDPDTDRFLQCRGPLNARVAATLLEGQLQFRFEALESMEPAERRGAVADLLRWEGWAEVLERPPQVVLAGPPNAGKSSLFNAWLREERVTVSPHPGTTRDSVEAGVLLGSGADAVEARLVDTAGIWEAIGSLDRAAVDEARRAIRAAWRVVWVVDAAAPPDPAAAAALAETRPSDVRLVHRVDLATAARPWSPEELLGGVWLRGSLLREGPALLRRLEDALLGPLGPPPPPGALVPLGPWRQRLRAQLGAE